MAEQTSSSIRIAAPPAAVMAVIGGFGAYPGWATGVRQAEVLQAGPNGRAERVRFLLDAPPIKDEYTLSYDWDGDHAVRWTLIEGQVLKAMDGSYELAPQDGETQVTYRLAVDVAIPMIGMVKRKAEKVVIDAALNGLKQRVESAPREP